MAWRIIMYDESCLKKILSFHAKIFRKILVVLVKYGVVKGIAIVASSVAKDINVMIFVLKPRSFSNFQNGKINIIRGKNKCQ